jgi:hypothetical protein
MSDAILDIPVYTTGPLTILAERGGLSIWAGDNEHVLIPWQIVRGLMEAMKQP